MLKPENYRDGRERARAAPTAAYWFYFSFRRGLFSVHKNRKPGENTAYATTPAPARFNTPERLPIYRGRGTHDGNRGPSRLIICVIRFYDPSCHTAAAARPVVRHCLRPVRLPPSVRRLHKRVRRHVFRLQIAFLTSVNRTKSPPHGRQIYSYTYIKTRFRTVATAKLYVRTVTARETVVAILQLTAIDVRRADNGNASADHSAGFMIFENVRSRPTLYLHIVYRIFLIIITIIPPVICIM